MKCYLAGIRISPLITLYSLIIESVELQIVSKPLQTAD